MKKLIFVRHSKAEDPSLDISDFERSLTTKGKILANTIALKMKGKESTPGILMSSPAFRAIETALIFAGAYRVPADKILLSGNIYYKFNFLTLREELKRIREEESVLTLFGHNPSFTDLAGELSKDGCNFIQKCGVVCISFPVQTWSDINLSAGKVEYYLKP